MREVGVTAALPSRLTADSSVVVVQLSDRVAIRRLFVCRQPARQAVQWAPSA